MAIYSSKYTHKSVTHTHIKEPHLTLCTKWMWPFKFYSCQLLPFVYTQYGQQIVHRHLRFGCMCLSAYLIYMTYNTLYTTAIATLIY